MKLTIKLLSDLCTYSGDTYNSVVDTDVVYDRKRNSLYSGKKDQRLYPGSCGGNGRPWHRHQSDR